MSDSAPETLHYIHLFIQLDSFTICTLVYIIITILLLHLHFTITFRQTTNSACAHQLRLTPQYDMHITSTFLRDDVMTNEHVFGASLSEPHIDELNVRNLYYYKYKNNCLVKSEVGMAVLKSKQTRV